MQGNRLGALGALLLCIGCTPEKGPASTPETAEAKPPAAAAAEATTAAKAPAAATGGSTQSGAGTTAADKPPPGPIFDVEPKCREAVTLAGYPPPPAEQLIGPTIPSFPCEPKTEADICEVQEALNLYQPYLESFGWQAFVAINWPAVKNADGVWVADRGRKIGDGEGDALPLWQTWLSSNQVFVEDPPAKWGAQPALAASCKADPDEWVVPYDPYIFAVDQVTADGGIDKTGPLVDQNGQWVQYDVRMNKSAWRYITENDLATVKGQAARKASKEAIDMPQGQQPREKISCVDWPDGAPLLPVGAIDLKAAWKVLGSGDDPKRYHTATMILPPDDKGACGRVKLGLAALHIKHKTPYGTGTTNSAINPHIWSTFIQSDALCDGDKSGAFCNANCAADTCPPNTEPCDTAADCKRPTPSNTEAAPGTRTQAVQIVPTTTGTEALNRRMQKALGAINGASVWQNYALITTQWVMPLLPYNVITTDGIGQPEKEGDAYIATSGVIQPSFAANPLIETYTQNGSSCLGCHMKATSAAGQPSDLSFQYRHAALRLGRTP